jgi:tetratricopeptide (TPR) repeat protein
LRGRLAWQSVQVGDRDFDILDARRYWETAVKQQPKSISFLNALGFAYYAAGDFNRANQAWYDALTLIEKEKNPSPEVLNTYAGLALGLRQLAQNQSGKSKQELLDKALQLHQKVMDVDAINFQTDTLSKNWMWSEQAIKDWQALTPTTISQK